MPTSRELMELIRRGTSPQEIMRRFRLPPSILRRMLNSKRLKRQLKMEADLTRAVVLHSRKAGAYDMASRLVELSCCEKDETARKVCSEMLKDGLGETDQAPATEADRMAALGEAVNKGLLSPAVLLTPPDQKNKREKSRK